MVGRDSAVSTATHYELDGPGIESQKGEISAPVQTGPGAQSASYTMGTRSFLGVKRPGRGVDHPPPSSAEVLRKSRAISLLPIWNFFSCSRMNFILSLFFLVTCG